MVYVKRILYCGNTIKNNEISFNDNLGVYIQANLNNVISNNNFINNSVESGRFPKLIRDAYFLLSRNNIWEGNYWNEPRTNPKLIWGIRGPFILRIPDFSDGLIFPKTKYLGIINIGFPIPAIDRDPAEKPYDIQ